MAHTLYEDLRTFVTPRHLRDSYTKYDISPFTRQLHEIRYLAIYETVTRNTISRPLRDKRKRTAQPDLPERQFVI
jgi:hypothetical protein